MAGADRASPHGLRPDRAPAGGAALDAGLLVELRDRPWNFGFFQALRRIECGHPDRPRIGASIRLADDPVRLGQEISMAFAPSTLARFLPGQGGGPPRITVRFFGLFGPNGPMPIHLTDYVHNRVHNEDDPTIARFADMFHHRMLSLFYRAWAMAQPTVCHDRPGEDRFARYVGSLFGIGLPALENRDAFPDRAKRFYTGHLSCQTRHPQGLLEILRGFFQIPVDLREFIGEWMRLPAENRCRIGESPATGTLGFSVIAGARIWECQHKFRIVFGPMGFRDFARLLPGGDSLPRLIALVRNYVGDELDWDVNMILKKEEVPPLMLGKQGRLGWTTWAASLPFEEDVEDLYLSPLRHVG